MIEKSMMLQLFLIISVLQNFLTTTFGISEPKSSFYQFSARDIDGKEVSMEKYRGIVVLVVNVASQCGFTDSNYRQMRELLEDYKQKGFAVAAFPCNQFGRQEPSDGSEIKRFVEKTYQFAPDLYAKVDVNGDQAHPIFAFLKQQQGGTLVDAIKWNFTKFLVDRRGHVVARFAPTTEPRDIRPQIEQLLADKDNEKEL